MSEQQKCERCGVSDEFVSVGHCCHTSHTDGNPCLTAALKREAALQSENARLMERMGRLLFVRFGEFGGASKNHLTGETEKGVSVYEAIERNGAIQIILPVGFDESALVSLSGCLRKPMQEVAGTVVGTGSDGEPVLSPCMSATRILAIAFWRWCHEQKYPIDPDDINSAWDAFTKTDAYKQAMGE